MHRIYRAELTPDFKIRTVFFNGEVREYDIEMYTNTNDIPKRMIEYERLIHTLVVDDARTKICLEGASIDANSLYDEGKLVGLEYIDDVNIQLANRLQSIRESKHMTQSELHKKTGIYQAEISKIERGIGNPSLATLNRLAQSMGQRVIVDFEDRGIKRDVPCSLAAAPFLKVGKRQGEFVIGDVYAIPDDVRVELIDGCLYDIAQPSITHQDISMYIAYRLYDFVHENDGNCVVLPTPALTFEDDDTNYLVPDIAVVCDRDKIHEDGIYGAPDLVIEIASKSNYRMDYGTKQKIYLDKGVREYWIVDPMKKSIVVYYYEESCIPRVYGFDDLVPVNIYNCKLKIRIADVGIE